MKKVGAIVGPFNFEVQHVHNLPHINGRQRILVPHTHPVSLRLHFQAVSQDEPSFLDIHTTRTDLESHLKTILESKTFNKPFEQIGVEVFDKISAWIPSFCEKFNLAQSFYLQTLKMEVTSHRDELHHSEGTTEYYVEAEAPNAPL